MKTLTFLLLAILPMILNAAPIFEDSVESGPDHHKADRPPLKLDITGMPEYPEDSNLRQLNIRHSRLIFYVDISSIQASKKDNVVRLTSVAVSQHGARTVTYEGLDCGYQRYQTYGYAGSEGPLRPFADQSWKPIVDQSNDRYRRLLVDSYLCGGFADAASRKKIQSRMQYLKRFTN